MRLSYSVFHLRLESKLHFGVTFLQRVKLLSQALAYGLVLCLEFLILLRVHLLDVLESLGSLFFADDRLALTTLDVAHYLIVSRLLLFVFLSLLAELELHELLFLSGNCLVLFPSLAGHLKGFLGSLSCLLELPNSFASAHTFFLLAYSHGFDFLSIFPLQVIQSLLRILKLGSQLSEVLGSLGFGVFPL